MTKKNNSEKIFIYGKHPVLLALKNRKRKFYKIYTSNLDELDSYIKKENIDIDNVQNIEYKSNNDLNKFFKNEVNHQGYVALVSSVKKANLDDFIDAINNNYKHKTLPKLLILDQLTDPHNIGAIMRTAAAFGVKFIIMTKYNSPKDSATILKSSAGMSENIETIEVININQTIEKLKKVGYFVIGLAGEAKEDIKNIKNNENLCLVLGSEGNGIRHLVKKNCDALCKINIVKDVESLNASVACAIAIYQIWG